MNKNLTLNILRENLLSDSKLKYILSQCTDKKIDDVIHDYTGVPITINDTRVDNSFGGINIYYIYHLKNNIVPNDYIDMYVLCGTDLCMNDNVMYVVDNLYLIIAQVIYDILIQTFPDIKNISILNTVATYTDGLPCQKAVKLFVRFE